MEHHLLNELSMKLSMFGVKQSDENIVAQYKTTQAWIIPVIPSWIISLNRNHRFFLEAISQT